MIDSENLRKWFKALQETFARNKEYLTDLDAAIGDADHGINMDRGFTNLWAELTDSTPQDPTAVLKTAAMVLIKTVGGAAGPLYGSFFLRASAACSGKNELDAADLAALFEAGLEGVVQRGRAEVNDKTMVDSLTPAVAAMKQAAADGADVAEMLSQAASAAEEGMRATVPLQAKKGRASYLGERSMGHQDPGATSSFLLIKTAAEVWRRS